MKRFIIGGIVLVCAVVGFSSAHSTAQSVPDFSGVYVNNTLQRGVPPGQLDTATGDYTATLQSRTGSPVDFERDSGIRQRVYPKDSKPWYTPNVWERVQFSDEYGHTILAPDPTFQCMPAGVPRSGPPQEIMQNDNQMLFVYQRHIRRIYLDGREHPPEEHWIGTWFGHSIGRWEADGTLVITTVDFNGLEWLGWPGWITTPDKRTTEWMRLEGDTLTWWGEVEDSILMQPFKTNVVTRTRNSTPYAEIEEPLPCIERDIESMFTRERG